MRAFLGLGEGVGNVLMGLPALDSLLAAGHDVWLGLRCTPPTIAPEVAALVCAGRRLTLMADEVWPAEPFDAACLTHWWLNVGGPGGMPPAAVTYVSPPAREDVPEIVSNLDAVTDLVPPEALTRTAHVATPTPTPTPTAIATPIHDQPLVAIHPGCKPTWRDRKLYPRWAEVVFHLKRMGARVVVVGSADDADIFVGEPHEDLRESGATLSTTRDVLASASVVLSGDSGIHHLAVALGRPTVAVFGQSSHVKAHHPDPVGPAPIVLGPFDDPAALARVHPRVLARAALRAAGATVGSA